MAEVVFARRISVLRAISAAAGLGAIVVGVLVLVGWALDIPTLKSVFPDLVTMKANTALAFILAGVSLRLARAEEAAGRTRRIARACAFLVALVGLLTVGEYLFGWSFGIDQLLFKESVAAIGTSHPGRMGLNTALNFFLLGSALLLLDVEIRGAYRPAQLLALIAGVISLVALLGHAYREQFLYGLGPYTRMSLHAALAFAVLCAGVFFARPERGLMAIVTSDSAGGVLARRLLPAAIGITLLLGWLRLEGQRTGLYGSESGVALFAAANILVLAVLIWSTARSLDHADIERRRAEEALRQSQERYRTLFESNPLPAWVYDINSLFILAVNDAAIRHYGYSREEFLARTIKDIRPAEDIPALLDSVMKATAEVDLAGAWRHRKKDGTIIQVETVSHKLIYAGRDARLVVVTDVTERKRTEQLLQQAAEARLQLADIVEASEDAIIGKTLEGIITTWNSGAERIYGYSASEAIGKPITILIPPERQYEAASLLERIARGEYVEPYETVRMRKDGRLIHLSLSISPIKDSAARIAGASTIARDVSAQKEAEEALRASEARMRSILNTAQEAFVAMDSDGRIVDWNPQAEVTFGWSRHEAVGRRLAETIIPSRYREAHYRGLRHFLATGEGPVLNKRIELSALHRDGHEFPVELTLSPIPWGHTYIFNAFIHDITERKRVEEEIRERSAELEAANKELEAFSYSVSHDLRAPLRSIDGFSLAVLEDYADKLDAHGKDYLQRVRAATQRMATLIDDLLNLSRVTRAEMKRETLNLSALVQAIAVELQKAEPSRRVEFVIAPGLEANGDPRLLRVVLENLLGNAWKFTSRHGRARIEFGVRQRDGRAAYFVRDDGAGFDPANAGRLFGPFQRFHATSEFPGTGVGLATVQRIIHRHGGSVWAEGAVEQGATFYFTL